MNTVTQAIIPQVGESIKSSHLYSLAEAFNSRILNGAGDSHWRIPYYIFSAYFRKPRLDDNMLYTPESEFFDFYQFVNPSTGETWPTNAPQEPEGANLQTNFLNRFIFGMNYETKNADGYWLYEREDVRVQKGQFKLKNDPSSFRGFTFPFFTAIGTNLGTEMEYTSFGLSSEVYSNGYISGNPENPQGNSFGGYYGKNPLITSIDGCGVNSINGYPYPMSTSTVIKIDGARDDKKTVYTYTSVCNEGTGDKDRPDSYQIINTENPNSILAFTIRNNALSGNPDVLPKNKYHLSQFQSTVFFGREMKNHLHRLLYNYITYAKGFDFDWFFNNQYAYAPEIGSFKSMISIYDKNPDNHYGRLNLISTDIKVLEQRLTLEKTGLSVSRINNGAFDQNGTTAITITFTSSHSYLVGDYIFISFYNSSGALFQIPVEGYYFISGKTTNTIIVQGSSSAIVNGVVDIRNFLPITLGYDAKIFDDAPSVQIKYYNQDGKTLTTKLEITDKASIYKYLLNNDFLAEGSESVLNSTYLYTYDNNNPDKVVVPLGFTLNNIQITSSTLKKCTLTIHYYVNNIYVSYRDISLDFSAKSEIYKAISSDIFLATLTPQIVYSVKFEVRNIEILSPNATATLTVRPVFLFAYKPKIEDAYALLRTFTYYGEKDGDLDDSNHPLKNAYSISNILKESGQLGYEDVKITEGELHNSLSIELNNNAVYEASRRLSLYARIIKPDNFLAIVDAKTLKFKRYAMQSANKRGPSSNFTTYLATSSLTVSYGVFATDDVINRADIIDYLTDWTGYASVYYSSFKRYNFLYETESNKINTQLNNNLIASLSTSTNYPTRVNKNNVEFEPTSYKFDYDSLVEGSNGKYLFYQFEDQYGVKFNSGSEDAPNYYAKRYTSENGSSSTNVSLDGSGLISLDSTDLIFLGQTNSKKASFYIYVFTRVPNAGGLASGGQGGRQFYHVDKNGSFITRPRTDLWVYNYSGSQAVKMANVGILTADTLPDDAIYSKLTYPNQMPIISAETIVSGDTKSSYILSLTELTELTNLLYNNYRSSDIQLNKEDASISYVGTSTFADFETFADINDYNKYLAGYKIKVSYFPRQSPNQQNFDTSEEIFPTAVSLYTLDINNNIINTYGYNLDQLIPLPKLSGSEIKIKIEILVNNRSDKNNKFKVNLDVYLAIINAVFTQDDPILESINREGGVFISRTANLIDTVVPAPTSRDMFQGIAPSIDNVLTGSLLVDQEYKVSGGTILHNGQNYGVGYNDIFIAKSTQYSVTSGTTPLIIQNNGIIEIAPPSGFSNEWAFWINFLPYSGSSTSPFKEEVYGATNSPFIDRCHINSASIIRSNAENAYFNLGLPKTYIPEMPPSYRYAPLLTKKGLVFENVGGNSDYQNNFYRACPAFKPPYKIKKAYVSSVDSYNNVYIELDREIDGYKTSLTESVNPVETYRTDYNGLKDWIVRGGEFGKLNFRLGDASITNSNGYNQMVSNTSNGYQGSYYPRFFFVKLIPKPRSDFNDTGDDLEDSPLNHDAIKQAELYLEAMREGFTANSSASRSRLSCDNVKGHLTPPDYKYDQLLINSTSTADYFGNKWPSLLTSSINFNYMALRNEDNPRGFGAIPFVGTYLEPYAAIAKSINNLIYFRVPFPLNYEETVRSYGSNENFPGTTSVPLGESESTFSDQAGPTDVANIKNLIGSGFDPGGFDNGAGDFAIYRKFVDNTFNLRRSDGSLGGSSAGQGHSIEGNIVESLHGTISSPRLLKDYTQTSLKLTGIDANLASIAYYYIKELLPANLSASATRQTVRESTTIRPTKAGDKYFHGSQNKAEAFALDYKYDISDLECIQVSNAELIPPSLLSTPLFYNYNNDKLGANGWYKVGSYARSSVSVNLIDSGFQIVELNTKTLISDNIT